MTFDGSEPVFATVIGATAGLTDYSVIQIIPGGGTYSASPAAIAQQIAALTTWQTSQTPVAAVINNMVLSGYSASPSWAASTWQSVSIGGVTQAGVPIPVVAGSAFRISQIEYMASQAGANTIFGNVAIWITSSQLSPVTGYAAPGSGYPAAILPFRIIGANTIGPTSSGFADGLTVYAPTTPAYVWAILEYYTESGTPSHPNLGIDMSVTGFSYAINQSTSPKGTVVPAATSASGFGTIPTVRH
jgi:hypothetical protein